MHVQNRVLKNTSNFVNLDVQFTIIWRTHLNMVKSKPNHMKKYIIRILVWHYKYSFHSSLLGIWKGCASEL
jgi:hypothetical protein